MTDMSVLEGLGGCPSVTRRTPLPRNPTLDRPPLMDLDAVARRLGVNHRHIRRLVAERRIPYLKWGTCCASTRSRSRPASTPPGETRRVRRNVW